MRTLLFFLLITVSTTASAQSLAGIDSALNQQRIRTDLSGMKILAGWGAANTIGGIAGFLSASNNERRSFCRMDAAFGLVNLSIASLGYFGARHETTRQYDCSRALNRYESTRRIYLLNAGLDGLYISTGLYLTARAKSTARHPEMLRGYGNALIMQGAALLLFDVSMYTAHSRHSKGWYRALQGVCIAGGGLGWQATF